MDDSPWSIRPIDDSPLDDSPHGRFAPLTIRPIDISPLRLFAPWTIRPHQDGYESGTIRPMDDSPPQHFVSSFAIAMANRPVYPAVPTVIRQRESNVPRHLLNA